LPTHLFRLMPHQGTDLYRPIGIQKAHTILTNCMGEKNENKRAV